MMTFILVADTVTQSAAFDFDVLGFVRNVATIGLILAGLIFVLAGTLGVLRLPDFFTRLHSAGVTDTLGVELILFGLIIEAGFSQMTLKLLMVSFFLLLTSPTATHAVANAAYRAGLKPLLGTYAAPKAEELLETQEKST